MMKATRAAAVKFYFYFIFILGKEGTNEKKGVLTEVTPALICEYGSHHPTTNFGGSKLGGNDGRKRIISSNTDTHL